MARLSDTHVTWVGRVHARGDVETVCSIGIAECEQKLGRIPVQLGRYSRRRREKAAGQDPELAHHGVGLNDTYVPQMQRTPLAHWL